MKTFVKTVVLVAVAVNAEASFFIDLEDKRLKKEKAKEQAELQELKSRQAELEKFTLNALASLTEKAEVNREAIAPDNLLLSKSTRHVYHTGTPREGEHKVSGRVDDISFSEAMQLLIPRDWDLYGEHDLLKELKVSWSSSDSWLKALERVGQANNLQFSVNWNSNAVFLSKSPDKGPLHSHDYGDAVGFNETQKVASPSPIRNEAVPTKKVVNKGSCKESFTLEKGLLKANIERLLGSCGYSLGVWNLGNSEFIYDFEVNETTDLNSSDLAYLIKYVRDTYGIHARIEKRSINFFGADTNV